MELLNTLGFIWVDQTIDVSGNNKKISTDRITKSTNSYSVKEIRKSHENAYAGWTKEDDEKLELLFCKGLKTNELAQVLKRNSGAINSRIKKLQLREKYNK